MCPENLWMRKQESLDSFRATLFRARNYDVREASQSLTWIRLQILVRLAQLLTLLKKSEEF